MGLLLSLFFLFRFIFFSFKTYEEPAYTVIKSNHDIQIRQYQGFNTVSTDVAGDKEFALKYGFRRLAGYIFGKNNKRQSFSMTIPVMLESNCKAWEVSFMLPRAHVFDDLAKPDDASVFLYHRTPKTFAVINFSGRSLFERFIEKRVILERFLTENHCFNQGRVIYAFYNPPWTLSFLRRNEVWIELTKPCLVESSNDEK